MGTMSLIADMGTTELDILWNKYKFGSNKENARAPLPGKWGAPGRSLYLSHKFSYAYRFSWWMGFILDVTIGA